MQPILLALHVAAGALSLLSGAVAAFSVKGSTTHRRAGRVFGGALLVASLSAVALSVLKPHPFMLGVGLFALFLTASGWVWGLRVAPERRNRWGKYAAVFGLSASIYMFYVAFTGGTMPVVMLVFGSIMALFAVHDLRSSPAPGGHIELHAGRMGGAFIASTTAFLVVNMSGRLPVPNAAVWLAPSLIGTPMIAMAIRRWARRTSHGA